MVAINASDAPYTARHQDLRGEAVDLLTDEEVTMDGQLELPPYSVQYLKLM